MRAVLALILVAGCSLHFGGGDDGGSGDDGDDGPDRPPPPPPPDPPTPCVLAEQYRMPHFDCGPLPPDAPPPTDCFWNLFFRPATPATMTYCYTDVCESLSYDCEDGGITAFADGGGEFHGRLLPSGNIYWDGGGYMGGEYTPY